MTMFARVALGSALISSSLAIAVAPSAVQPDSEALITPAPQVELLKRQNNDRFMGWIQYTSDFWSSQTCATGNTYYQSGDYWACCATSRAGCLNMPIGCVSGNMIFRASATATSQSASVVTLPCTSIWTDATDRSYTVCNTGFMFQNSLDSSPKTQIFCGIVSSNWSYYRQQPQTAAATTTPRTTTSSIAATSTPPAAPTVPVLTNPDPQPKEESKAWIAGAVVGPIAGLALIGLGIFFFMRRKKNKSADQNLAPATGSVGPAPTAYQQNNGYQQDPNGGQPPQYYPPPMQQNAGAPGFVPVGVQKHDSTYYGQPQSPVSPGAQSPNTQSTYGAPQQWQQPGGQPNFGAPSPSMSPAPQHAQPAQYNAPEPRAFSSELEGSHGHAQPEIIQAQPKTQ